MNLPEIVLIAIGLSMDAFAVALGVAAQGFTKTARPKFRLSFHFGLFQFLMPVIGWYLGASIRQYIEAFDHWVAFMLLAYVGGKMIYAAVSGKEEKNSTDPTRKFSLLALSVATSIDALAVGLSLAMINVNIWYPAVVIGIITATLSFLAMHLGTQLGLRFGRWMELFGGFVLVAIGIKILLDHL